MKLTPCLHPLVVLFAVLFASMPGLAAAERLETVSPAACVPRAEDYTTMWWAHGLRHRSPDGRLLRCVRTGQFGLAVDVEAADVLHLGPIAEPRSYAQAVTETNATVLELPTAKLDLEVELAGKVYRCVGSAVRQQGTEAARLIESGRFMQRSDLLGLEFADDRGNRLRAKGRLEIVAWPDRLALLLEVQPAADWRQAVATIRLTTDGHKFSDRTSPTPWPAGERRTASIVIVPVSSNGRLRLRTDTQTDHQSIQLTATDLTSNRPCGVRYDAFRGCHRIDLNRVVPQGEHNDALERVKLELSNPLPHETTVRLSLEKGRGGFAVKGISPITGLSPMLRDTSGNPLGIPVQISKNWHRGRSKEPLYEGPWLHGTTMLRLPPRSKTELEFTLAYAHWGGVPAASHAQLCLIGWGNNQLWEESAIGAWGESICFEPDQGQRGGTVLDARPLMVWAMKQDQRRKWSWTNNVGGADFLVYYDADGVKQWNSRMRTMVRRCGPNLTEVTYAGRSADGKIELTATVSIHRTDDVTRGLYRFRYDVRQPVEFSRLVLFQCGGDDYSYTGERTFARGNESGLAQEWETQWGGNRYKTSVVQCTGRVPWFSMHRAVSRDTSKAGAWANRGLIVRHWDARLGGKEASLHAAERGAKVRGTDTSLIDLLPPPDVKRLLPGDYVEAAVVHVIVPQRAADYYGPNKNLRAALARDADTWKMIHREAIGNDLKVTATRGRVLRNYPVAIELDANQSAAFTVTGGIGYVPITLDGLTAHAGYELLEIRDGVTRPVDQSVHGNDYWQTDYNPTTRRYSRTYTIPLDTPGDRPNSVRFVFRRK